MVGIFTDLLLFTVSVRKFKRWLWGFLGVCYLMATYDLDLELLDTNLYRGEGGDIGVVAPPLLAMPTLQMGIFWAHTLLSPGLLRIRKERQKHKN